MINANDEFIEEFKMFCVSELFSEALIRSENSWSKISEFPQNNAQL